MVCIDTLLALCGHGLKDGRATTMCENLRILNNNTEYIASRGGGGGVIEGTGLGRSDQFVQSERYYDTHKVTEGQVKEAYRIEKRLFIYAHACQQMLGRRIGPR